MLMNLMHVVVVDTYLTKGTLLEKLQEFWAVAYFIVRNNNLTRVKVNPTSNKITFEDKEELTTLKNFSGTLLAFIINPIFSFLFSIRRFNLTKINCKSLE